MKQFKTIFLFLLVSATNLITAQESIILCNPKKEIDLTTFMDTYEQSEDVFRTLHVTKQMTASEIGCKDKTQDFYVDIYATKSGSVIYDLYETHVPKENEIFFLFENDDPATELSAQSIFFKFGAKVSVVLKNKSLEEKEIIGFLKCTVFPKEPFFYEGKVKKAFKAALEKN